MNQVTHTDDKGRKYVAMADDTGQIIIVGPPEGLVDELGLPESFATNLHNILFDRGMINYLAVKRSPTQLTGALQEVLQLDTQKLMEAFFKHTGG